MQTIEPVTRDDLRAIRDSKLDEIVQNEYHRIYDEIFESNLICNTNCTVTVLYRNHDIITGILSKLSATFVDLHIYVGNRVDGGFDIVMKWD
jgi:hypothetical protein